MSKLVKSLQIARGYLEKGWTQNASARNESGAIIGPHWPQAVCWCLTGACTRSAFDIIGDIAPDLNYLRVEMIDALRITIGYEPVIYNDSEGRRKEDVLMIVDATIARLKAQEAKNETK